MSRPFRLSENLPLPADRDAADRLVDSFSALGPDETRLARRPVVDRMLRALGGNSPYLAELALREHESLTLMIELGPGAVVARALTNLRRTPLDLPRTRIAAILRGAKRRAALAIAIADIGGSWRLERVSRALSALAEATLSLATRHLLRTAHNAGWVRLPHPNDPDRASGFVVLGMGKLGARELNYSSDVDLVLLYDPARTTPNDEAASAAHVRLARDLVALMQDHDEDGYVFRIDLRLRPDPAATGPVVALPAALSYYESIAQNWERAAMIKARPVAGDRALGQSFLDEIHPFVWRRYLDFAAIEDIHAMRRRIDSRSAHPQLTKMDAINHPCAALANYNVKLGPGGIRTIEFLTQTLQLVWGGRDPDLRVAATMPALKALARKGVVTPRVARELTVSYRELRGVEHRLQMVADRQTHSFPASTEDVGRFLIFLGRGDGAGPKQVARRLLRSIERTELRYREMIEPTREERGLEPSLDLRGIEKPGENARNALATRGFKNPDGALAALSGWENGRLRALQTERARELLMQLLPAILSALAQQRDPDAALAHFDRFLAGLSAGVQILSLFERHPGLLARIAGVLGAAPSLAEHLARNPGHLDGLLAPDAVEPDPEHTLRTRLSTTRNFEQVIEEIRAFVQAEGFRISVATLDGRLDVDEVGVVRTRLAEAALRALVPNVLADFADRFGTLPSGRLAVVALGKAGGRVMMAGSDLDLMLIYDHAPNSGVSRGRHRLAPSEWFIRAAHAFVAALSAPGPGGPIYAIDMRLRPSGNKGPVAVSLDAFERYHATAAWTWERMALTRARVVAGPPEFRVDVERAIRRALEATGNGERIRRDAAAMRERVARERRPNGRWDIRLRAGGSLEVDFLAQALQLIYAPNDPTLWTTTTGEAFAQFAEAQLLDSKDARFLIHADRVFRTVQGILRVALGSPPADGLPDAAAAVLVRAVRACGENVSDVAMLEARLTTMTRSVRTLFERTIGPIGEQARWG